MGSPASLVRAHGPSLSIFDVLDWENDSPKFVRLLRGAATFDAGTLRYVCPARWGGEPLTPLMLGTSDRALVVGASGLFWFGPDNAPTTLPLPEFFDAGRVRGLFADESNVGILTADGDIFGVTAEVMTKVLTLSPPPDSVGKIDNGWLVANEDEGRLTIYSTSISGQFSDILDIPYRAIPELVIDSQNDQTTVWILGTTGDGHRLDRLDGTSLVPIARTADPISGPVTTSAGTFVVIGGQLQRIVEDALVATVETPRLFCLRRTPRGELLACVGSDLVSLDPEEGLGAPLLEIHSIQPPSLEGLDPTETLLCRQDWADAARDAGLPESLISPPEWNSPSPSPPVAEPPENRPANEGCTNTNPTSWVMLLFFAIFISNLSSARA